MIYPWQNDQWHQLQRSKAQQRLPHALLLQGPSGCGKHDFSLALAASLLCQQAEEDGSACGRCHSCQLLAAGSHPDFHHIKPLPPKNSSSSNPVLSIKVDAIRALCATLATTSQLQGYRIALIEQADKMLHHAANSLLKTLEEPGRDTLILLHTARPNLIPITVRSRCQLMAFPQPDTRLAQQWLQQNNVDNAAIKLQQSHGAPLIAADEDTLDLAGRATLSQALLAKSARESSLHHADAVAKLPKYQALSWTLDWITDLIRIHSSLQSGHDATLINESSRKQLVQIAQHADARRLFAFYDSVCDAIHHESIALNSQLLWENLLISWDNL